MDAELIRYKNLISELEKEIQKLTGNMEEIVANLKERLGVTDKLTHEAVLLLSEKEIKKITARNVKLEKRFKKEMEEVKKKWKK